MTFLIKGKSLVFRQTSGTPAPEVDGGGTPIALTPHLISGRSEIFRQWSGIAAGPEVDGGGTPVVIGPHLIAGKGQIYRVPGNPCSSYGWHLGLVTPGLYYYGSYVNDPTAPFIHVLAQAVDIGFNVDLIEARTYLPGLLTYPTTPTITITDTDITMTVQGYSVTASYAAGVPSPVPPPDFGHRLRRRP